ncbi:MAG: Unknown protein [uncultured Campylobacterales bacterium]|uniref:Uncharacterized protein n=1 Tax=uncultured Campylobacterales bacterium TaxID=352960 RepID=A0A6S6SKL9_9BACT|nr:MAG: Unknown protein [uncultured Campylobacterales bacterium]
MYIKLSLIAVSAVLVLSGCGTKKYVYKNDVHTKKAVSILIDKIENLESQVDTLSSNSVCDIPEGSEKSQFKDAIIDQDALDSKKIVKVKKSNVDAIFDPVYFGEVDKSKDSNNSIELTANNKKLINLKPYKVTAHYVNVRSSKSKVNKKNVIDVLPKDEPVYVSEITDGWAKIGDNRYLRVSTITPRTR